MTLFAPPALAGSTNLLQHFRAPRPIADVAEIVFVARGLETLTDGHWYANFGYYAAEPNRKAYGVGGKLYRLNLDSGQLTTLLADAQGTIRDPQVHYDAARFFSAIAERARSNITSTKSTPMAPACGN